MYKKRSKQLTREEHRTLSSTYRAIAALKRREAQAELDRIEEDARQLRKRILGSQKK